MEQVILQLQNLTQQLRLLPDSPPIQGHPSLAELMAGTFVPGRLPRKMLGAI